MGGISPDQQLKLAALRFRSGNDFWTGPLTNDGSAEVDATTCDQYDNFFISTRADAERHRQYFDCTADPECDLEEQFPNGYSIPSYFFDYPAHGNTALNQDFYLSPFLDYDGNGFYDPSAGDYPWYDFFTGNRLQRTKARRPRASVRRPQFSTGFSTTKEMCTRNLKESRSEWKSEPKHLPSPPMMRSIT